MPVAAHVDRCAIDMASQIGAMIQVEAAQEELVSLARAAVLGGDQPGHRFGQFADPRPGPVLEVAIAHRSFARGVRDSGLPDGTAPDDQLVAFTRFLGRGGHGHEAENSNQQAC